MLRIVEIPQDNNRVRSDRSTDPERRPLLDERTKIRNQFRHFGVCPSIQDHPECTLFSVLYDQDDGAPEEIKKARRGYQQTSLERLHVPTIGPGSAREQTGPRPRRGKRDGD